MIFLAAVPDQNFVDTIISTLETYISVPFVLSANIVTYGAIKFGEYINKEKVFSVIEKRIIAGCVTILLVATFDVFKVSSFDVLFLSGVLSPFTYSLVLKNIFSALNISIYRKEPTNGSLGTSNTSSNMIEQEDTSISL